MKIKHRFTAIATSIVALNVYAGAISTPSDVILYSDSRLAQGTMIGARYSSDSLQYIGCAVNAYGGFQNGSCSIRDRSGVYAYCYSSDASLIHNMRSIQPHSYIVFSWNESGQCQHVYVNTVSNNMR